MNGLIGYLIGSTIAKFIWKRKDERGVELFGFLRVTFGCFPWQESEAHRIQRRMIDSMPDSIKPFAKNNTPYAIGWRASGDSFYRAIGFKLTRRDIRLDVWIGIIWISWLPFNPTKPKR